MLLLHSHEIFSAEDHVNSRAPVVEDGRRSSSIKGCMMLATSSSSNFTPFRQRAGRIGSCRGFSLCVALSTVFATAVFAYSLSIAFHHSRFFATLICVSLFCISFRFVVSVSSKTHLPISFFGLPTDLFVWRLVLRPGFHVAAFFVHRSSGSDAILIARCYFILLCVSTQHGILAAFILSMAIAVLLFKCLIHSSCPIATVSISSSESFMKETSLAWSQSVSVLLPSAVFIIMSLCGLHHFPRSCGSAFSFCIFSLSGC